MGNLYSLNCKDLRMLYVLAAFPVSSICSTTSNIVRRVWRCQRGNQNM